MQVEAAAALAPVLARFAIVVDGPLEAEVVTRLASGGERMTTLADLARPFPGRTDLSRPEAVAVARAVVTRLMASGAVEAIAGGYRIADPKLAATLQRVVEAVVGGRAPASPSPTPGGQVPAAVRVSVEDASRVLQQTLSARSLALPQHAPAAVTPASGPVVPPGLWVELVAAGWTTGSGAGGGATAGGGGGVAASGITLQPPTSPGSGPAVRLVVADADAPVALVAPRLAASRPVVLSHLPAPPVTWGQGDPELARTVAAGLRSLAATPGTVPPDGSTPATAPPTGPLVVDRGMVPALTVLARQDALPSLVIVDLRSAPSTAPPRVGAGVVPTPAGPDAMAAAMAGAAGAAAQRRRARPARARGPLAAAALMEVLFGPRFAASIDGDDPDDQDERGDGEGHAAAGVPAVAEEMAPTPRAGAVVTSRTKDRQATALAELLGVEVRVLSAGDDLGPEVLAWLDDETGSTLLAPRA